MMITPPSASSDAVTLYSTDEGSVVERDDGSVTVTFDGLTLVFQPETLVSLRDSIRSLAADVRRCGSDCRWQLRLPDADQRSVLVLTSEDVLALEDLVAGASAMLELNGLLDEAGIETS